MDDTIWKDMIENRRKYRNPSPPPGYVRPNPHIALKPDLTEIDGQIFKFLALTIESGILEDSDPSSDFTIQTSDDDVLHIPVAPKVPPLIYLDVECLELSDGEIPGTPEASPVPEIEISSKAEVKKPPAKAKEISETEASSKVKKPSAKAKEIPKARSHSKAVKKDIPPPPTKVKKHHSKKEKIVEYSSDSSTELSSYSKKKEKTKKKHRSRSPSSPESEEEDSDYQEDRYNLAHIKQEDNLFGFYHCPVCKLRLNAECSYQSHLNGKRHLKALKAQSQYIAKSLETSLICNIVKTNRYPTAPPNVLRMQVQETARAQRAVEERVLNPCPGLQKVIEIQGLEETHYYCELCDAPCSHSCLIPHLQGRKHQLMCLSIFDERSYNAIKDKSNRKELDVRLHKLLRDIENIHGLGRMTVEKEIKRKDHRDSYNTHRDRAGRREDIPGPSHRYDDRENRLPESFQKTIIPDTSKSDFYCKTCDSHMNNINMWQAHVIGKRHLKNVKRAPGEVPSKIKSIPRRGARALIMKELDLVEEPVVGLQFMRETQNPEVRGVQYNCFPCGACLTHLDVIDHILTQKHRTKFLEKIEHPDMLTMSQMDIQGSHLGCIVEETCAREEAEHGRGIMEVHVLRSAISKW